MALAKHIYNALEDIVGTENITAEPVILDSYAYQHARAISPTGIYDRFGFRPGAVVLPSSTEEVQAIVKSCNRYKIRFKAHSTGWGAWGAPGSEGVVQLDLRRMNRILEINERNMYAVVEPYVIGAQLQAELMKRGLNCQIITAGSNASALPLSATGQSNGFTSVSTGQNCRNVLGVEWVLPTGEILKLGSLGSGAGWFSGDGPGPSLRGIVRGYFGSAGGVGVFTKAATKVYHWAGPPVPPIEGRTPAYRLKLPSTGKRGYCFFFPSWEKLSDANCKIAESEIAFIDFRLPLQILAWILATSNKASVELLSKISEETKGKSGALLVVLSANSPREFDYQERVLKQIVSEEGGESLSYIDNPFTEGEMMWHFIRNIEGSREHRPTSAGLNLLGVTGTWDFVLSTVEAGENILKKYIDKGVIMDTGGEDCFVALWEHGHCGYVEQMAMYDPLDTDSSKAARELRLEVNKVALEKFGTVLLGSGDVTHDIMGPSTDNYHLWMRQLKKAFDPNVASDPSYYITPK